MDVLDDLEDITLDTPDAPEVRSVFSSNCLASMAKYSVTFHFNVACSI